MYAVYSTFFALGVLVASPYFLYQALRYRKYVRNLPQRLGFLPWALNPGADESIWIHAVSVGEVLTARALLPHLRARYPRLRLFVSTTTTTGQEVARRSLQFVDGVFYLPFDLPPVVGRTLRAVRPRLFLAMETEIWPNLLRACRLAGVETAVVNGRISARSFPRYWLARVFFRRVLSDVGRFCMQSEESARRIVAIGAEPARVSVTGSLKFDAVEPPEGFAGARNHVLRYFRVAADRPVVIAASTLKGEEEPVLDAFRRVRERCGTALLVIAPRKPERFEEADRLARRAGWRVARRTELQADGDPGADVIILDTIGELAHLYRIATVVFVGGSLVDAGGHNILEPAIHGKPIVFGPHMHNFTEIARAFLDSRGAIQVDSAAALASTLAALVGDPVQRASLGAAARALVDANRGATAKTLAVIAELLPVDAPDTVLPFRAPV